MTPLNSKYLTSFKSYYNFAFYTRKRRKGKDVERTLWKKYQDKEKRKEQMKKVKKTIGKLFKKK